VFSSGCWLYCSAGVYGVKQWEREQAETQIIKIRASLNDNISAPNKIKRLRYPSGRLYPLDRHENKVAKLALLEKRVDKLMNQGLVKWFNRAY
jgi:hypothetical protein